MLLKKLVIAEDDDAVAHLVAASLGDAGFLCLRARDGDEALNLTRSELPDALVLDVMMPRMDGIEVCRRLKGDVLLSRVPILLLTSLAGVDDRVAGLEAGADDYLPKPFDLRELAARVKAMIRQSRRERDRNPTTNLPGNEAIEDQVTALLHKKKAFDLLYLDIENYRSYADVYGYRKAEEVVAHTGALILAQARRATDPPAFVGHLGGDDFIVIADAGIGPTLSLDIERAFNDTVPDLYSDEDRARGVLLVADPQSEEPRRAEFMRPSIALLQVASGQYTSVDKLATEVTRVKAETRRRTGSGFFAVRSRRP